MAININCHPKRQEECNNKGNCPDIDGTDIIFLNSLIDKHGLCTKEFEKAVRDKEEMFETDAETILKALEICAQLREEAVTAIDIISTACHFGFDGNDKRPDPNNVAATPIAKDIPGEGKKTIH